MKVQKFQVPVNGRVYLQDLKGHVFAEFPAALGFWQMLIWDKDDGVRKFQFCRKAVFHRYYPISIGEKRQYKLPGGALIITEKPLPDKFQLPKDTFSKLKHVAVLPSGAVAVKVSEDDVTWNFATYKRADLDEKGQIQGLYWYDIDD